MYNYLENVKNDVKQAIFDNYSKDEIIENLENSFNRQKFEEKLNDELWVDDAVTGNASGSYTFSTYQAEQNLNSNLYLLKDALECFGENLNALVDKGAEYCDVTIRCYLLPEAIVKALDEIEEEMTEEF